LIEHFLFILDAHRHGFAVGSDKIAYTVGFLDHKPDVFRHFAIAIQFQLNKDITGVQFAVRLSLHTPFDRAHALTGDQDTPDDLFDALNLDLAGQRLQHSVFFIARHSKDKKLHNQTL